MSSTKYPRKEKSVHIGKSKHFVIQNGLQSAILDQGQAPAKLAHVGKSAILQFKIAVGHLGSDQDIFRTAPCHVLLEKFQYPQ